MLLFCWGNNLDVPPGFNFVLGIDTKHLQDQPSKRVTRSQTKKSKRSVNGKQSAENNCTLVKAGKGGSPLEGDSPKTTESMLKVANEALQFGELLGLRVVSKRENALKRITTTLKNNRL